jgi:anti-repressor protein
MSSSQPFNLSIALMYTSSDKQFPVDFNMAWEWLGFFDKQTGKKSLDKSGFILDIDYRLGKVTHTKLDGSFSHISHQIDLTVDCFKMWAMMAGTQQGKEVRLYFLECERMLKEKQASQPTVVQLPMPTHSEALRGWATALDDLEIEQKVRLVAEEAKKVLQAQIEADAEDVAFSKALNHSPNLATLGKFITSLNIGRNTGFAILREQKVIQKYSALPYQSYVDLAYFKIQTNKDNYQVCLVTPKGEQFVTKQLLQANKLSVVELQLEKTVELN